MRYREPYTIFPRKLKSGRTVWYYRTYSPSGERTVAHSTGQTTKTQARNFCADLLAKGMLFTGTGLTFRAFAEHFYDDDSEWMVDRKQTRGDSSAISKSSLSVYRYSVKNLLIPFFGRIKLCDLNTSCIKRYRTNLVERGYSNNTINSSMACLKVIVRHAMACRYITYDPFITIKPLFTAVRERDSFTADELARCFSADWGEYRDERLFSITAAVTGMRLGEITAMRAETLSDGYIEVSDQITKFGELTPVKTNEARKVRICRTMSLILRRMAEKGGFIFGSKSARHRDVFYEHCLIDREERAERKLTFHSLRHFFNTYMLANGIPEIKVRAIMGHSSGRGSMTERYSNFRPEDFDDVAILQERLLERFGIGTDYVSD